MFTMTIYITETKYFLYFRKALDITKKVFQFQLKHKINTKGKVPIQYGRYRNTDRVRHIQMMFKI